MLYTPLRPCFFYQLGKPCLPFSLLTRLCAPRPHPFLTQATKPQQRFGLTKSLIAFAIVAVAAGAAMLLSGGAQKAAPAAAPAPQQQKKVGKGVSWRL